MNLSERSEYALRSLVSLGIARETGRDRVHLAELARAEGISENFLRPIFITLSAAGLVESVPGEPDDHRLGRPAGDIVLGDIVRLIDEQPAPVRNAAPAASENGDFPDESHYGLRLVMRNVSTAISGILDRFTLADVVATTVYHRRTGGTDAAHASPGDDFPAARTIASPQRPWFEEFLYGEGI